MLKGIDVSRHNGTPDFASAKSAGISFVYVKATEGKDYRDPLYQPDAYNAMKAGLPVGFYHFARPDKGNKPEDEAQNFVSAISVFKYNLLPVLDLEVAVKSMNDDELYKWAKTFIDVVKAKTGNNVMFYTGQYYLDEHPALKKLASECPLWVARYRNSAPVVNGWVWTVWQFSDKESVPGVGSCDADYVQDLNAIMIGGEVKVAQAQQNSQLPLKRGSTGDLVKQLQARLGIPADGVFGAKTEQAIMDFQKAHGLVVDGVVGQKTWAALFPPAPPMYRVTVDGKAVVDSAVPDAIAAAVKDAVSKKAKEIIVKPR